MRESAQSLELRIKQQRAMKAFPPGELGTADIPASRYTSQEWFALEQERVFRGPVWLLAGHGSRVAQPGDYFTFQTGPQGSVLVVRNREGRLRAFHNVCRHRGFEVAQGSGNAGRFRCAYHGWTYDLDGQLTHVVDEEQFHGLERSCRGLLPVRAETWAGWIWLTLSPAAPPLREYVRDFAEEFEGYGIEAWEVIDEDSWVFPANWKVVIDNFIEVYHIPNLHPQTVTPFFELRAAVMDTYERHTRMVLPFKFQDAPLAPDAERGVPVSIPPRLDAVQRNADMHYLVYPNTVFNLVPTYATMFALVPLGVRETRFDYQILGIGPLEGDIARYYEQVAAAFREPLKEDFGIFAGVQRGLDSRALGGLPLNYQEVRIRHFHEVLSRDVGR